MKISIDGNIGCGKSSLLTRLASEYGLPAYCEPVRDWTTYLAEYYRDPKRWAFCLNLKTLASFSPWKRGGLPHAAAEEGRDAVTLWERHPMACRRVFTQLGVEEGYIDDLEVKVMDDVASSMPWTLPDVLIYIKTTPQVAYRRTTTRARACEEQITLTYLERVDALYDAMVKDIQADERGTDVWTVDGDRDAEDVFRDVSAIVRRVLASERV